MRWWICWKELTYQQGLATGQRGHFCSKLQSSNPRVEQQQWDSTGITIRRRLFSHSGTALLFWYVTHLRKHGFNFQPFWMNGSPRINAFNKLASSVQSLKVFFTTFSSLYISLKLNLSQSVILHKSHKKLLWTNKLKTSLTHYYPS